MKEKQIMKAIEIRIEGKVQGVGMRFFLQQEAKKVNITGHVSNLPTKDILIIAEGTVESIEKFTKICQLGSSRSVINKFNITNIPYTGSFSSFNINYQKH